MKRTVKGFATPPHTYDTVATVWLSGQPLGTLPVTLTWDDGKPAPKRKRKRKLSGRGR